MSNGGDAQPLADRAGMNVFMMRPDVRILLLGEPGVGKTSLILSLVSEEFPEEVPHRAEEITIPADVTPEKVPTHIVDYSAIEQDENQLIEEIHRADVICIVYSVDDEVTIDRITERWLPLLRAHMPENDRKPVVLVGNKSDVLEISSMETILPIMNEYVEVETCVECSAKTLKNISEVFYYAQKAVLHPTAPLYRPTDKELTAKCQAALTRIFKICDQDNDWILNDREIYQFQRRCFNVPLQPQALEDVKTVVRKHISEGVQDDGITHKGFLFLHTLFIQRGRHETTWTVLRKFGYDDTMVLAKPYTMPPFRVCTGCATELTSQGLQFFSTLFTKYDEDRDNCLSPTELTNLFSTCPTVPWGPDVNNSVATNSAGWITKNGYLAQWMVTTLLDAPCTLEYLAHLGFMYEHESQLSAVQVTREKKVDIQKRQTSRSIFLCHVIGPKGVGKTSFLQGLLGRSLQYVATLNKDHLSNYTTNTLPVYGQNKQLVLQEINVGLSDVLSTTELQCDVACLLYDATNPKSFEYCARIYTRYLSGREEEVPCLIVGCKAEGKHVPQDHILQPEQFCLKHGLPPPQLFTCLHNINRHVYVQLATMASSPHLRGGSFQQDNTKWIASGLGVLAAAGLGLILFKYLKANR